MKPATVTSMWGSLYKLAGVAALTAAGLFLIDVLILAIAGPLPDSADGWFTLLHHDRPAALLKLFFTDLIGIALIAPIVLGIYVALRQKSPALALLAAAFSFVGIALVLATNPNFVLIHLSDRYAAASTNPERASLLTEADLVLASGSWGTGTLIGSFLLEGALLTVSILMVREPHFGKAVGYLGIVAHGLDFAHALVFLFMVPLFNTALALAIGTPLLAVGGTLQLIWYPLTATRLLRLSKLPTSSS